MKPWLRISPKYLWTALGLIAVAWVTWRVTYVRRSAFDEVASVLDISLSTSKSATGSWAGAQRDRVVMAAQLANGRDLGTTDARRDLQALLDDIFSPLGDIGFGAYIQRGLAGRAKTPVLNVSICASLSILYK